MCTSGKQAPRSVVDALAAMDGILGYLRDPGTASLLSSELGGPLEAMATLSGKFAAVRAGSWPGSTPSGPMSRTGTDPRRRG